MEQLSLLKTGASVTEALDSERLIGSVEKIVYFNEETGQSILDLKLFNQKSHVLISARLPGIRPGETVEAKPEPGQVADGLLHCEHILVRAPQSPRCLKKFLKSGIFPDVGPHLAGVLSQSFPENFFLVLEQNPDRLLDVSGVGRKRRQQILQNWIDYQALQEIENFFFQQSLPLNWAKTLWLFSKSEALIQFQKNPYQSIVDHQFDFETIDAFALSTGFSPLSPTRIRYGILDVLQDFVKQGHCACPEAKLIEKSHQLLAIDRSEIENQIELECLNDELVTDTIRGVLCIYQKKIWDLERKVAQQLLQFRQRQPPWGWVNNHKVIAWAQSILNIQLAPKQQQAIETVLNSSLTVITGGPGTGKTTLVRSLVTILQTQFSKFALCTPTGRAAQRIQEATGVPAQTIHRLLKFKSDGTFQFNETNPLNLDLVLIDEASMVDLSLMSKLLEALPDHCALVLVGDADQIPPVGAGSILQSTIASDQFQVVRLTEIFRQQTNSLIKLNAHRINQGLMPTNESQGKTDFHYIPVFSVDETKRVIQDLVLHVLPEKLSITDPRQFQILVPINRGPLGTQQLNEELQQLIRIDLQDPEASPVTDDDAPESLGGFGQSFKVGDKVMVVKNDYGKDVFNGDIGFIDRIDHGSQCLYLQIDDRNVRFSFEELDKLSLAYAISIHKSQGSEYRAVIVVVSPEHLPLIQRHLIYTALTRGKEFVFLVADPSALQAAIESQEGNQRWQKLTELLQQG